MAKYATLKAAVEAAIKTNGQQQITGQVLQTQLVNMITSLGKYFQSFGGLATPAGSFSAGDESVTFLAVEAGTYTNFGGAVLDGKTLHILAYDGDWADVDTSIPSGAAFSAALALAIKGSQSGIAEGIADTISAGTAQEFLQRQSGGDGVNCLKRIKGKTIAWNQLVDEDTTEVTIPSGHKYFAIIGGTASVATSDGTAIAVTGGVDIVVDLTLLGLGDLTAAQFEALYPELYYAPASVLKSNDAAALLTDGRNQWDEQWLAGYYQQDGTYISANNRICSKNWVPVFPNTTYFLKSPVALTFFFYDADKNFIEGSAVNITANTEFTTPANACWCLCYCTYTDYGNVYKNDICINISWSGYRNGEYEPYWQRVLALRLSELTGIPEGGTEADRVTMFPNGLGGAGSAFDSIFVENGVTKARGTMLPEVDLGDLAWTRNTLYDNPYFEATITGIKANASATNIANIVCSKYATRETGSSSGAVGIAQYDTKVRVFDSAYTDAATFKAAMAGVKLLAEAATPIIYTDLQYADGTPFTMPATILVDNGGTERIQAPEGSTTPSAPFCCDSNYSIGVANLVKRLAALENAE